MMYYQSKWFFFVSSFRPDLELGVLEGVVVAAEVVPVHAVAKRLVLALKKDNF